MPKIRTLLFAVGILAVPALAIAASGADAQSCCPPAASCCEQRADCCKPTSAEKQITCPLTGETINESECPLCSGE